MSYLQLINTPLGKIKLYSSEKGISSLNFLDEEADEVSEPNSEIAEAVSRYFQGELSAISELKVDLKGTAFQLGVWDEISKIEPGKTISYTELAVRCGRPSAVRAVANACGANPVCLIVPCHRVITKNYSLGGYRGGVSRKEALLKLEGCYSQLSTQTCSAMTLPSQAA